VALLHEAKKLIFRIICLFINDNNPKYFCYFSADDNNTGNHISIAPLDCDVRARV